MASSSPLSTCEEDRNGSRTWYELSRSASPSPVLLRVLLYGKPNYNLYQDSTDCDSPHAPGLFLASVSARSQAKRGARRCPCV